MLTQQIQQLIAAGKTGQALSLLIQRFPDDNTLLILGGRFNHASRQYNLGVVTNSDYTMEINRINHSILEVVSGLEPQNIQNPLLPNNQVNGNVSSNLPASPKILFISASPIGYSALRFTEEENIIRHSINNSPNRAYQLIHDFSCTIEKLLSLLKQHKPDVVHISMHNNKKEGLLFVNEVGERKAISVEILCMVFKTVNKQGGDNPIKTVIINACNSEKHAEGLSAFVPNVIGMKDFIPDDLAIAFTKGFYNTFFLDDNIESAIEGGIITMLTCEGEYETNVPISEIPIFYNYKAAPSKFLTH